MARKCATTFILQLQGSHHLVYVHKHKKLLANNHGVTAASIDDFVSVPRKNNSSTKKDDFIAWLTEYASSVGDYMPDEESIVLPYPKFEGVRLEYKQEKSRRQENDWLCYSYARRIF